ncbi:hypothetical protein ACGF5C_27270 [Micromonospora sp. NPDC047620]|uniref:hypothetical protein n=1 Tax=Micromonospora sp. NPDC047620 TaxID=3364251 RepID=UPI003715AF85
MRFISDFERAAVPGSRWMCVNRIYPGVSGLRTITGGKTVLSYDALQADGKTIRNARLELPKASECHIDGDSIHFLSPPGTERIAYTWTLIPHGAPDAALRPPRFIAAHPIAAGLRGPGDTPWCVFDTVRGRMVSAAGPDTDEDGHGAYFATEADAAIATFAPTAGLEDPASDRHGVVAPDTRVDTNAKGWSGRVPGVSGRWAGATDTEQVLLLRHAHAEAIQEDGESRTVTATPASSTGCSASTARRSVTAARTGGSTTGRRPRWWRTPRRLSVSARLPTRCRAA